MRFEPAGMTDDPDIRMAQSMLDYIFRRLALDYLPFETRAGLGIYTAAERTRQLETGSYEPLSPTRTTTWTCSRWRSPRRRTKAEIEHEDASAPTDGAAARPRCWRRSQAAAADAPLCVNCGTKMRPAGSCFVCEGCGSTSGCS